MKNRIGIIGGGQLGRMLGIAAKLMGFYVTVIDPTPNSPAGQVVDEQIIADYKDEKAIRQLAKKVDYLTFEIELANSDILNELIQKGVTINPSPKTLQRIKDKFLQKQFLTDHKLPTAESLSVETEQDIKKAGDAFGYPFLLKARYDAYDGRGNVVVHSVSDISKAMERLKGRALYVEKYVPFIKELAMMVARNTLGEIKTYPLVETIHQNNICHTVIAPADVSPTIQKKARVMATKTMKLLEGAGVFGIEMFLTKKGDVLINEIAPRVHNSGHYTIEACVTNQFEQHVRAVTGMPLGSTKMIVPLAVMVNILGERQAVSEVTGLEKALALSDVAVHIYGKAETKHERKMGHITVVDDNYNKAYFKAKRARGYLSI